MDPNPKNFPILSYVMSRLHSAARLPATDPDIEAAAPPPASPSSSLFETELVERMPHLRHPDLLASMARAVSNVYQTRAVLRDLGERPDHEAVDFARARLVEIDAALVLQLEEIARSPLPDGSDPSARGTEIAEREKECRAKADAQKARYKAVVQLEDMHEAYENLLKESEERLEKIYVSNAGEGFAGGKGEEEEDEQVNEEIVAILQDASLKSMEMVNLSGRRLRILPEDFGKIRCLVSLDLSNNRLEALPDAIAGLEKLEKLYLSSNFLVSLPDSIGLLLNLKILDVSSNKLKALPNSISFCRSLVELNASYNALTYLPTNIGHELINLEKLYISFNKIRSLPSSICEMRCLRVLDAHFNELHGLPYSIGRLTNLETMNLSGNFSDLRELPPTFGDLINLRELDLSNNQIHALPDSFGRLENLTELKLEQNPLAVPPVDVANQGVEAIKMYMSRRWLDMLIEEEQKSQAPDSAESKGGWLSRSTSWLSGVVTGVSASVAGYFGDGEKSYKDPCLDQQF